MFLMQRDPEAGEVIDSNSVSTFFAPLADMLLKGNNAVLAKGYAHYSGS